MKTGKTHVLPSSYCDAFPPLAVGLVRSRPFSHPTVAITRITIGGHSSNKRRDTYHTYHRVLWAWGDAETKPSTTVSGVRTDSDLPTPGTPRISRVLPHLGSVKTFKGIEQ